MERRYRTQQTVYRPAPVVYIVAPEPSTFRPQRKPQVWTGIGSVAVLTLALLTISTLAFLLIRLVLLIQAAMLIG